MAVAAVLFIFAGQLVRVAASQQDAVSSAILTALKTRRVSAGSDKLVEVEGNVFPTFQALSKNEFGRLEAKEVGYIVHRYFGREHGLRLAGLDGAFDGLASAINATGEDHWMMDALAAAMRDSRGKRGLSVGDVALVAAAVEQVVLNTQHATKTLSRAKMQKESCAARRASLTNLCKPSTGRMPWSAVSAGAEESFNRDALTAAGAVEGGNIVLLANYLSLPMHCTATTELFSVCCTSGCESIARHIESKAMAPKVSSDRLVQIASAVAPVARPLQRKLNKIAQQQGGDVLVHSAEFAEWLHYAFPAECPLRSVVSEEAAREAVPTVEEMLAAYMGEAAAMPEAKQTSTTELIQNNAGVEGASWQRNGARLAVFALLAFAMLRTVVSQWRQAGGAMRGEDKDAKKGAKN
eukprot:TRINITY_DN111583_c0_g1_i1.p1 TRINITY_DN111583_c0_g1~~TRINITY_DN111583_c0_g1_i1.p1  ORF type:complete len:428 (+),score=104.47 TRINITY_DN111583_c0_g1_i1:59-1285(+)